MNLRKLLWGIFQNLFARELEDAIDHAYQRGLSKGVTFTMDFMHHALDADAGLSQFGL